MIEWLKARLERAREQNNRLRAIRAHYYSTHCLHGHHEACKGQCKYADDPVDPCHRSCMCTCHK